MKDTVIKNDGTSKLFKAPATMPETYEEFRQQALNGQITFDVGLNPDGCDVVGTPLNKETLLQSDTAAKFDLDDESANVDSALKKVQLPQLVLTAPEGSSIVATDGVTTFTGEGGTVTFILPNYGSWTVTASRGSEYLEKVIEVDTVKQYKENLTYVTIFGIRRDITSSLPDWERIDESVGYTVTATVGATAGHSDFDDKPIYSEIKRVNLPTNDVMVKIPAFYYQRYKEGNYEYIRIADRATSGFKLHPAFDRGDYGKVDCIYVGAYKMTANYTSQSGKAPLVNQTRATFRNGAKNKGAGWNIIDIAATSAIQMLALVEFATYNLQGVIGQGYSNSGNTAAISTGSCDSVINLTGRLAGTNDKLDVVYRGIEGLWGNVWEWTDGLNWNGGTYYVSNNPNHYADDTASNYKALTYTGSTGWSQSYIQTEGFDENEPWAMMPSLAGSGSGSTYITDAIWSSTGWRVFARGGDWASGSSCGLFACLVSIASSDSDALIGSRLLYIPL